MSKVQQETETQRAKAEADAEARRKTEQEAADAALDQTRKITAAQLAEARQARESAQAALAQAGLQHLLEQTRPSPATARAGADPAQELARCVSVATVAPPPPWSIQARIETLQRWRKAAALRRGLLTAFAVVGILFVAAAGFLVHRAWRIERTYRAAVAALDAGEWEKAQAELQQLISLDSNYKDAQTLLRESYYRPAVAALEAGEWEMARADLEQLGSIDGNYKDAQTLLRESYYRPTIAAIDAKDWKAAATTLALLVQVDRSYKYTEQLLHIPEIRKEFPLLPFWVEDFQAFDSSKYYVLGDAYWDRNNAYFVLTKPERSQGGRIFLLTSLEMRDWVAEFDIKIGEGGGLGGGADGMTLAFG